MNKKFTFIDLFSGAGGLSCGFEKAGLTCLAGIDFLKPAIETFKKNHKNAIGIDGDIRKILIKDFKKKIKNQKVNIICGGPPCQGFSTIGPGDAKDSRNHLFLEFVRFVKELKPEIIVLENVTGLLAKKNIKTLQSIFNCFEELGYDLNARVLSSHHYGAPQIRRRVILIGNRIKIENIYPQKKFSNVGEISSKLQSPRTVSWAFKNLINFKNKSFNHNIETASIKSELEISRISHVPEGKSIRYERDEKKFLPKKLWFNHDWSEIGEKRFREAKFARLDRSKPSPTIVTGSRMYYHPIENRYLTTREAASLQSFPAEFEFFGSITSQWTQIGNAVPPLMAEAIGDAVKKMLKNKKKKIKKNKQTNIEFIRSTAFNYDKDVSNQEQQLELKL
jgi:DNA (cytosine-5)-methyltransferase 1|tara:strand:- start:1291 stop:2466 length:1176 start_codon:yes stop_codon:yes gene_type:complete